MNNSEIEDLTKACRNVNERLKGVDDVDQVDFRVVENLVREMYVLDATIKSLGDLFDARGDAADKDDTQKRPGKNVASNFDKVMCPNCNHVIFKIG